MYDFYKILDIPRDASPEEIKKAYRNKAKLLHPDVNASPKANEVFAVVSEAYEVLTDETRRYLHDVKLNYADSAKVDAERKRHYYGSSVKNNSYTNVNYDWAGLEKAAYKEKTDEDYYRQSPFFYNLFFVSGMTLGFIIIGVMLIGTYRNYWPFPFVLISISGAILVREGWKGMIGKRNILGNVVKKLRR